MERKLKQDEENKNSDDEQGSEHETDEDVPSQLLIYIIG
jgi:hypothetical protein